MKTIKELRRKVCKKEYDKLRYLKIIKVDRKVNKLEEKIYQKKYRNLNKEKINEYRNLNKEKINEYRNLNKEKIKENRNLNKEKIKENRNLNKEKIKEYRNLNKEKIKEYHKLNKEKINEKNRNRIKKKKSLLLEWDYLNPCEK